MYAVIQLQGHQYIVQEGDEIVVDTMALEDGKKVDVDQVLAIFDDKGEKVAVWSPTLKANVYCEVAKSQKGEKLRIIKFKRKNRYTRTIGFRQRQTVLKIKKVEFNG